MANQPASQRDEKARLRAELMAATARHESEQAQRLIDDFLIQAKQSGLPPVRLMARTFGGHLVKTDVTGWYLRNDHAVAIGLDGRYYQLVVPDQFAARLRGVKLAPAQPMLVVGRGAKDGETGSLKDFLARVLRGEVA